MLRGWHARNGVSFGNPRLGFVCTKQTVDGQNGLEGFYYEYDHDLAPDERLVFARHLEAPAFDPAAAPHLASDSWPRSRLEKAYRNYAMEYVRSALPVLVQTIGPHDAAFLLHLTGRLIGMQFYPEVAAGVATPEQDGARGFGEFLLALLHAEGDEAEIISSGADVLVSQNSWTLIEGAPGYHPACLRALVGLIEGLAEAFDRRLSVDLASEAGSVAGPLIWTIRQRRPAAADDGRFPA